MCRQEATRMKRDWFRLAENSSGAGFEAPGAKAVWGDWSYLGQRRLSGVAMKMLVCMLNFCLLPQMVRFSTCELVQFAALDGSIAKMSWSTAGADFEPYIIDACTHSTTRGLPHFDGCALELRKLFLAADLKLWNALDGKNLTWEQRPARSMPALLADQFTFGGKIQHLRSYRSDSGSNHRPYSNGEINALIEQARKRVPGSAYPEVDFHLYSC